VKGEKEGEGGEVEVEERRREEEKRERGRRAPPNLKFRPNNYVVHMHMMRHKFFCGRLPRVFCALGRVNSKSHHLLVSLLHKKNTIVVCCCKEHHILL
jgi:hypothetical protein